MRKTTIELSEEQYFFLKEKALELQKSKQNASIVSIIRSLIEKDRLEWVARNNGLGNESLLRKREINVRRSVSD